MAVLLDWLMQRFPRAKRTTLRRMLAERRIFINGVRARSLKQAVVDSDQLAISDRTGPALASLAPLTLIYEDDDLIVIDKPPGLLTSTVARERRPTALAIVQHYVAARAPRARVGLIHRLDRDASGLLVFSKTPRAYTSLKTQFYRHSVQRIYHAVVWGTPIPPEGRIESHLVERADGTVHSTRSPGRGQRAVSHYQRVRSDARQSLLRVKLETGRKHQIRVHLSERGMPVVNDAVYGTRLVEGRLMLAAVELMIMHPRTGRPMAFGLPAALDLDGAAGAGTAGDAKRPNTLRATENHGRGGRGRGGLSGQ